LLSYAEIVHPNKTCYIAPMPIAKTAKTFRPTKPGPKGPDDAKDLAIRTQIRLYRDGLVRIDKLVAAGDGSNASEVIRRSLHETHMAELGFKRQGKAR